MKANEEFLQADLDRENLHIEIEDIRDAITDELNTFIGFNDDLEVESNEAGVSLKQLKKLRKRLRKADKKLIAVIEKIQQLCIEKIEQKEEEEYKGTTLLTPIEFHCSVTHRNRLAISSYLPNSLCVVNGGGGDGFMTVLSKEDALALRDLITETYK